uniref:Pyrin domain-containing protein n=1 Tax=Paramormyrops kingsleyae TaxID=1676925 RepID=A0A3B3STG6_9TELE
MRKSVLDCVIGALDDLSADNFKRFKVKLCEPREIKYGQIEKESKVEVAQRIVSVFTNDGAVNQTADVLRAIGLNGEAEALPWALTAICWSLRSDMRLFHIAGG